MAVSLLTSEIFFILLEFKFLSQNGDIDNVFDT